LNEEVSLLSRALDIKASDLSSLVGYQLPKQLLTDLAAAAKNEDGSKHKSTSLTV